MENRNKKYEMPPTIGGYNFFECASALQKFIRRGMEHEAMYIATELYMTGKLGQINCEEYVWYRLIVMASEDIGLAEPNIAANIWALYQMWEKLKAKGNKHKPERLQFTHAVMLLCRSYKSRMVDMKLCYYWDMRHMMRKVEIPDWAYDQHTWQGRAKGRGVEYFYEESAKINPVQESRVPDEKVFKEFITKFEIQLEKDNKVKKEYDDLGPENPPQQKLFE